MDWHTDPAGFTALINGRRIKGTCLSGILFTERRGRGPPDDRPVWSVSGRLLYGGGRFSSAGWTVELSKTRSATRLKDLADGETCMTNAVRTSPEQLSDSILTVTALTPVIGAEISGIDLREPLTSRLGAELRQLLARYKVIFFRDQSIDADQHLALGRSFGSLLRFPGVNGEDAQYPGLQVIGSWRPPARRPDGGRYTGGWHIDASGLVVAPFASILRAVTIPPVGGDTVWANLAAAYEGLPDDLKLTLEDLYATDDLRQHFRERGIEYPLLARPIVRIHPETGEKVLAVNFTQHPRVVDWTAERSAELIQTLKEEATRPEYQVRFRWSPGAITMWDNRAVHHYAVRDYGDFPRRMERVLVAEPHLPLVEELI
ncbi:MAG: TauD/TfdA dioxygenase family protein [Mycobacterium sp.]